METDVTNRLESLIFSLFHTHTKSLRQEVTTTNLKAGCLVSQSNPSTTPDILTTTLPLYYHYIPSQGKKSSSRLSVDTSKPTYIQCRRSLLHFSPSTSGLTISASTHLRNLYISKKIPSQCRYQAYTLGSSILPLLTSTPTTLGLDSSSKQSPILSTTN
ncbi:hypothetical protein Tco_0493026 [Tanacetum coccineum]